MNSTNPLKRYRNTKIIQGMRGEIGVQLHNTVIVWITHFHVQLNSGGYKTTLTKNRMNEASEYYDLGFKIVQKEFNWFVVDYKHGETIPFKDNMFLKR